MAQHQPTKFQALLHAPRWPVKMPAACLTAAHNTRTNDEPFPRSSLWNGMDVIRPNDRWFREHFGEIWDNGFAFFWNGLAKGWVVWPSLLRCWMLPLISKWANRFSKNIESPARSVRRKWKCALVWANGKMTPSTQRKAGVAWAQPSRLAPMWLVRVRDSQWKLRSLILEVIWKISKAFKSQDFGGLVMWFLKYSKTHAKWGNTRFGEIFTKGTVWF